MNNKGKSLFDMIPSKKDSSDKDIPVQPAQGGKSFFSNPIKQVPKSEQSKSLFLHEQVRKRINVSVEDLKKYNNSLKVLEKALDIILTSNLERMDINDMVNLGKEAQTKHQQLVEDLLNETQNPVVSEVRKLAGEIVEQMEGSFNWFGLKADTDKDEILSKSKEISLNLPKLQETQGKLNDIKDRIESLNLETDIWIVVATFFSEYKPDENNQIFGGKLLNLLSTKQNLINNRLQHQLYAKSIQDLIELIGTVMLTDIPAWCSDRISKNLGQGSNIKEDIIQKIKQKLN